MLPFIIASEGQRPVVILPDTLFFMEGQSNCYGAGLIADLSTSPINEDPFPFTDQMDRVWIYNQVSGTLEKLNVPENNGSFGGVQFGIELGIGQRWMEETVGGNLIIFKSYIDGSPIANFQKGTGYYTTMQAQYADMVSEFAGKGLNPTGRQKFIWIQGENDSAQTQAYYHTQLQQITADRIADGMLDADCKQIITKSTSTALDQTNVNAAKEQYAGETEDAQTTDYPNFYKVDNIHLTAQGNLQMAYEVATLAFGFPAKNVNT